MQDILTKMDSSKVYKLIHKLQRKYGLQSKSPASPDRQFPDCPTTPTVKTQDDKSHCETKQTNMSTETKKDSSVSNKEEPGGPPVDWCLTDRYGQRQRLPKTMIFLGREECDIILQSDTVDKRHAVVTFDHYLNKFKIKDLSTANGTYVNDRQITEQTYVTLEHLDNLRLGFDPTTYHVERMDKLGGEVTVLPQSKPPVWASRHLTHMAECKGCIAEQQIHHTCGIHIHHSHDHHREAGHSHLTCNHGSDDMNSVENGSGSNTWPRKGERPSKMQPTVQKEVMSVTSTARSTDLTTSSLCSDLSIYSSPPSSSTSATTQNSKTVPETLPVPSHTNFVPSATSKPVMSIDKVLSSTDNDPQQSRMSKDILLDNGIMKPERDTNNTRKSSESIVDGKSADSKQDLERSVKGTPLYGQPSWWGEDEEKRVVTNGTVSNKTLSEGKHLEMPSKGSAPEIDWGYDPEKYKSDPKYSQRYMEIPARDTDPGFESPVQNNESSTSLLSKDSLSSETTPIKHAKEPSIEKDTADIIPKTDASALAFTVDLGDEKPNKKLNMSGSLSEFVPSKIRRSFRERSEKSSAKTAKDENLQRELKDSSPDQQKKFEEIWGSIGETNLRQTQEGYGEEEEEEEDLTVYEETKQQPIKKAAKSTDGKSPRQSLIFDSSTFKKSKPGSHRTKPLSVSAEVPLSDPATFLIDKMFETSSHSKPLHKDSDIIPQVTEHSLYKESSHHDIDQITKSSKLKKTDGDVNGLKPKKSVQEPHLSRGKVSRQKGKENVIDAEEGDEILVNIDQTSEAGTYTIELDDTEQAKEEKEARQSIDKVFGIPQVGLNRPVKDTNSFPHSDLSHDFDDVGSEGQLEQVEQDLDILEWQRADCGMLSSMEVEVGSGYDKPEQPERGAASKVDQMEGPGPLLKQRTFLKEAQPSPDGTKSSSSKDSLNSINSMSPADRPPSGQQKKRPGTGRKLPSLPSDKGSPRCDASPRLSDIIQRSKDLSPKGDPSGWNSPVRKDKTVTISSQVIAHDMKLNSTRSGSTSDATLTNVSTLSSQSECTPVNNVRSESARSLASIDTEILLRDTETVMAAMEARMVSRQRAKDLNETVDLDCDSDISSTVAVVNSDNAPKSRLKRGQQDQKRGNQRLSQGRTQLPKPSQLPRQNTTPKTRESPVSLASLNRRLSLPGDTERSTVSDVLSDADNDSISVRSDASTDYSESSPKPTRKGSKGKANITMTRPNRAFQLRKLRAEGSSSSPDHTKSETSSVTTSTPKSTGRPVSGRSGSRPNSRPNSTGYPSDRKSDASLGAAIAHKGKQNTTASQQNFARKDGGRHSLRSTSAKSTASSASTKSTMSGSTSTSKTSTPETIRKKEIRDLKTHLKKKQDLTVTGVSQKSRSQPPSRSNSPKTQERNAWKRRKEYDPRKAVAQAKAKAKASSNPPQAVPKTKQSSVERSLKMMSRSASYTNPEDFNKFGRESLGREPMGDSMSSDDLNSSLQNEAADNFDESRFKRPLRSLGAKSMSSIRDQSGHSGDENSSSMSEDSPDLPVCYGMLGLRPYKSAFTPPPKSRSPSSSPISPPSRRANNNTHDLHSAKSVPRLSERHHTEPYSQSYDNLIISSIYQLSLKLKTSTDRTLEKLRDNRRVSGSPSPVFEMNTQATAGDIPAWNAANQELAAILKNLRKMDHRMQVINKALFPGEEGGTESARLTHREKKQYLQEIQRIHELAGFRPIDNPEQVWRVAGDEETEDVDDNTSNVSEIEDFVDEDFY